MIHFKWSDCHGAQMDSQMFPVHEDHLRDDSYKSCLVHLSKSCDAIVRTAVKKFIPHDTLNSTSSTFEAVDKDSFSSHEVLPCIDKPAHTTCMKNSETDITTNLDEIPELLASSTSENPIHMGKKPEGIMQISVDITEQREEILRETAPLEDNQALAVSQIFECHLNEKSTVTTNSESETEHSRISDQAESTCLKSSVGTYAVPLQHETMLTVPNNEQICNIRSEAEEKALFRVETDNSRKFSAVNLPPTLGDGLTSPVPIQTRDPDSSSEKAHEDAGNGMTISLKSINDVSEKKGKRSRKQKPQGIVERSAKSPKKKSARQKENQNKIPVPISSGLLDEEENQINKFTIDPFKISLKEEMKKDPACKKIRGKGNRKQIMKSEDKTPEDQPAKLREPSESTNKAKGDPGYSKETSVSDQISVDTQVPLTPSPTLRKTEIERHNKIQSSLPVAKTSILSLFKPAKKVKKRITREYVNEKGEFISEEVYE